MARIGPSSPHVPYEMMASPMGGAFEVAFLENRHECAESGGGKCYYRGDAVDALLCEEWKQGHDESGEPQGDDPCDKADFALMSGESFRVDFIAGEQE